MAAAIAQFDERELDQVYDEALSIHPIEKITRNMILPLLVHLGERWQNLPGAIAEEHFFAMYLRSKLGARLQHRMRYATGPRIVAACAPGEQHEIGLLLFALEAHQAGLQTVLLGADTPLEDVAIAQRRSGGDAVVISSSDRTGRRIPRARTSGARPPGRTCRSSWAASRRSIIGRRSPPPARSRSVSNSRTACG